MESLRLKPRCGRHIGFQVSPPFRWLELGYKSKITVSSSVLFLLPLGRVLFQGAPQPLVQSPCPTPISQSCPKVLGFPRADRAWAQAGTPFILVDYCSTW